MGRLGVGIELVGRRHEVSVLVAALERAVAGRPTALVLSGDAGVGKSRLVAEAAERAAAGTFTVLVGRCLDTAESAAPYLPFTEVVARLATVHPDLLVAHTELGRLLPGVRPSGVVAGEDRELGQLRVFDAVLSALDELTRAGPVLLVLEDLHWADRSTRDLLVFLLSRLTAQRLVVLATYRTDDLHRRHPLRPVLSELVRLPVVERIELAPLEPVDALDLVTRLAAGTLSEPVLRSVARRSEGNAFFAEELVAASSDGLPHGLAEVLVARVEALAPATARVLRVASVAGRRVRHERLRAVSGLDDDQLEQALRDAVAQHVLVPEAPSGGGGSDGDGYAFRHALLREAIYHELLPGERSRLHAAYVQVLADRRGEPGAAAELSHHALAAHDLPRALVASVQAAREASDHAAPAELLRHAERALDLWGSVPDAEAVSGVDEGRITRWAAWAASTTGDPDRGIALGRRAMELAERDGDPVLVSMIGRDYALRLLELSGHEQEVDAVAERALALIVDRPASVDLAWAHVVLGRVFWRVDRFDDAARHARSALEITGTLPPEDRDVAGAAGDALITLAICSEHGDGDAAAARRRLAEAAAVARRSGNLGVELRAHFNRGMSLLDGAELATAAEEFAAGEARAAATGTTWSRHGLDLRVAHVVARFLHGRWDEAEAAAAPAGESVSTSVARRLAAADLLTSVGRGRLEAAERRWTELQDPLPDDEQLIMLLGQAGGESALWRGEAAEATSRVEEAGRRLHALSPFSLGGIALAAIGVAAGAQAAVGRPPSARELAAATALVAAAEEIAARGRPRGGVLGPEGRAWLCRAHAELTRLTGPDPAAWTAVVAAFSYESDDPDRTGERGPGYRQAYAVLRRAEAHLALGEPHRVVEPDLRAALGTAERLGAHPLAGAVRAMAERAGVRLGPPGVSAGPGPLTPRERSVLALVAGGRTNRQVGAELFISEKTVSVHLSRVMAKLGAAGRTQAVSVAYARGLLAPANGEEARPV